MTTQLIWGCAGHMDLLSKFQLSNDELFEVFDYCKEKEFFLFALHGI